MIVGSRTVRLLLGLSLLLPLASCANSGVGKALQDSLAADPRLTETKPDEQPSPATTQAELPADFPSDLPRYPNATLQQVIPANPTQTAQPQAGQAQATQPNSNQAQANLAQPGAEVTTVWQTTDSRDRVLAFYQAQLQTNGWTLGTPSLTSQPGTLVAKRATPTPMQVTVIIPPPVTASPSPTPQNSPDASPTPSSAATQFTIRYSPPARAVAQASPSPAVSPTPSPSPSPSPTEVFLGVEGLSDGSPLAAGSPIVSLPPNTYTDLSTAPDHLVSYLTDLAQLGVLNLEPTAKGKATPTTFSPNKPVSRREYARWLFETNNRLFGDRPAQQIRPGNPASPPAFRDVPPTDPDFATIQGLAEAGIIPSALTNDGTSILFQPDAQLNRETLLLWKVPMDIRQPLPTATLDAIKQTWGFQDAARIDPKAQRAILADFQNGEMSNIRRVFGYTTLFQPKRPVSRAEAASTLWYFGYQSDGISARTALKAQ